MNPTLTILRWTIPVCAFDGVGEPSSKVASAMTAARQRKRNRSSYATMVTFFSQLIYFLFAHLGSGHTELSIAPVCPRVRATKNTTGVGL